MDKQDKKTKQPGLFNGIISRILRRETTSKTKPLAPETVPIAPGPNPLSTKELLAQLEDYPPHPRQTPAIIIPAPKTMRQREPIAKPIKLIKPVTKPIKPAAKPKPVTKTKPITKTIRPRKPIAKTIKPTKKPTWPIKSFTKTIRLTPITPILPPEKKLVEKKPAVKLRKPAAKKRVAKPVKKLHARKAKRAKKPIVKKRAPVKKAMAKKRKPVKKSREAIPKKVKKALKESAVSKSKIARMLKSRGPGWHGESIRHHKAALKAWETRRKKQLKYLEKKEKKKGLTKAEIKKKKDLGQEVVKLSKAIAGLEGHLKEIEKQKKAEKPQKLSFRALHEARRTAERTAETVKAQANTGLEVMRETRIAAERTAEAAKASSPKDTAARLKMMEETKRAAERTAEATSAMSKTFAKAPGPPVKITLGAIEKAGFGGNTDEEIGLYKKLIKRTQYDFFKRIIKEPDYKKRISEYRNRLIELEERKKIAEKRPKIEATPVSKKALASKARDLAHQALRNAETWQPAPTKKIVRETVQITSGKPTPTRAIPRMPTQVAPARATGRTLWRGPPRRASNVERIAPTPAPLTPKAIQVLRAGTPPEVTNERVAEIEGHIGELLKKYRISAEGPERESLNKDRIIQDFDKLINLIELEKRAKKFSEETHMESSRIELPRMKRKQNEIKAIAKEIKKYRIVTDFDRVLSYVREKGKVSESMAIKDLKMAGKQFKECRNILDKSELIKVVYPPIGGLWLMDINYKAKKKEKKKKG